MLKIRHELPSNFFELDARELHDQFQGPTLIHLPGKRAHPVFATIMLHGNEDVGLKAVQTALTQYAGRMLPRELILFIGNTEAAAAGLRKLPNQLDYNRVWPGSDLAPSSIAEYMSGVVDYARRTGVFVSLDLHNNTGTNPYYGCINRVDAKTLQLAILFARTVVYFRRPLGVQSAAMSEICPALTCECGKVGDAAGVTRAAQLIEACLQMQGLPDHYPPPSDFHLLRTLATIKVKPQVSIGFSPFDDVADWVLPEDIAQLNFRPLPVSTVLGRRQKGNESALAVINEDDEDVTDDYLSIVNEEVVLKKPAIPSMLTTNLQVIRDDCLGYFMEEYLQ